MFAKKKENLTVYKSWNTLGEWRILSRLMINELISTDDHNKLFSSLSYLCKNKYLMSYNVKYQKSFFIRC